MILLNWRINVANGKAWWAKDTHKSRQSGVIKFEKWDKYMRKFLVTGKFDRNIKPKPYI